MMVWYQDDIVRYQDNIGWSQKDYKIVVVLKY